MKFKPRPNRVALVAAPAPPRLGKLAQPLRQRLAGALAGGLVLGLLVAAPFSHGNAFDLARFKEGLSQELLFREAALHVAWGAEPLCDDTSEIEPFVLWSTRSLRKAMSGAQEALFTQATGMDGHWRVAWADEAAPDALKLGARVLMVNRRALPEPSGRLEITAVLRGGDMMTRDDRAFWQVMLQAREEAQADQQMTLTLEGGQEVKVPTQTGCAGVVLASAFDNEPANFLRQDGRRVKLPGHALMAARDRDELRWLAAFGTYFLASEGSILRERSSDTMGNAFLVGKVLTVTVPGAGTLLAALEASSQRTLQVDGLVGAADLFANEVVMALGGDPAVGLRLANRLKADQVPVDVLQPDEFRRANIREHLARLGQAASAQRAHDRQAAQTEARGGSGEAAGGPSGGLSSGMPGGASAPSRPASAAAPR